MALDDLLNSQDIGPILGILLISALFVTYYNGETRRVRVLSFEYVSEMADLFQLLAQTYTISWERLAHPILD